MAISGATVACPSPETLIVASRGFVSWAKAAEAKGRAAIAAKAVMAKVLAFLAVIDVSSLVVLRTLSYNRLCEYYGIVCVTIMSMACRFKKITLERDPYRHGPLHAGLLEWFWPL
jgi:hypothetical protein